MMFLTTGSSLSNTKAKEELEKKIEVAEMHLFEEDIEEEEEEENNNNV
jgi:hypothetical protein